METIELKKSAKRLYENMDDLLDPIVKIRGYIRLAKDTVGISAKDFGLTLLAQKIAARDSESVRQNLILVVSSLNKYKEQLNAVGLNDAVIEKLNAAVTSITNDNNLQFEIVIKHRAIIQNNLKTLNDLHKQLSDLF
jgi:hypothetical protein